MNPELVKLLLLGRLVSFMLLFYIGFAMLVEWKSVREGSKLKGFSRLLCRPLTAPIVHLSPEGTPYATILRRTGIAVVALWLFFVIASEVALTRG
jgi:hypothetical protein